MFDIFIFSLKFILLIVKELSILINKYSKVFTKLYNRHYSTYKLDGM